MGDKLKTYGGNERFLGGLAASGADEGGRIAQCLARKGGQTDY